MVENSHDYLVALGVGLRYVIEYKRYVIGSVESNKLCGCSKMPRIMIFKPPVVKTPFKIHEKDDAAESKKPPACR